MFLKYVHFNKRHPENHNLAITNIHSKFAHIRTNNMWQVRILNELLDKFNLNLPSIDNLSEFTDVKFNVLKTKDKKYVSFSDIKNDIKNLEVFDLITNKMVKFDEISQNI